MTCATLPPLGLKKKFEILVKLRANLKKHEPKNGKSEDCSIHSSILGGPDFSTFRGCHATPLTFGVWCVMPKVKEHAGWLPIGPISGTSRIDECLEVWRVFGRAEVWEVRIPPLFYVVSRLFARPERG